MLDISPTRPAPWISWLFSRHIHYCSVVKSYTRQSEYAALGAIGRDRCAPMGLELRTFVSVEPVPSGEERHWLGAAVSPGSLVRNLPG